MAGLYLRKMTDLRGHFEGQAAGSAD